MKKKVYHWYPDREEGEEDVSYPKTACGRDGAKVGGLITSFFRISTDNNCRHCQRAYERSKK